MLGITNGNGDAIIQNLANALNNILSIINNIIQNIIFQWLLDIGVTALKIVTDAVNKLTEAVLWVSEKINEFINFIIGHSEDLDGWAILIGSIATAIGLVVGVIVAYNIISAIATIATTAFGIAMQILTSPITLIILAIAALIAIIALCVKNWETIKETVTNVVNIIKEKVSTAFNNIKTAISNAMDSIKITISNVWNAIWGTIRNVINSILGGIESFVNGTIKGINKLLSGISSVANAVGSLIGLNPINLQISTISLPKLAKGGVLTQPTTVLAGEYSGARSNPEIVTPQNIMYDTMRRAIEDTEFHNGNSGQHLSIYYMGKEIFDDTIDYINEKSRRTGKCVIRVN